MGKKYIYSSKAYFFDKDIVYDFKIWQLFIQLRLKSWEKFQNSPSLFLGFIAKCKGLFSNYCPIHGVVW